MFKELKEKYFRRFFWIFSRPYQLFDDLKKDLSIRSSVLFFVFVSVSSFLLSIFDILIIRPILSYYAPQVYPEFGLGISWFILPSYLIASLILLVSGFLYAGILFVIFKLYRSGRDYSLALKIYVYSQTPFLLFRFIPNINIIMMIYSFVLQIFAVKKLAKVGLGKSLLINFSYLVVIIALDLLSIYVNALN